jgi:hypothetical protein
MMTRESDCFAIECVFRKYFLVRRQKNPKNTKEKEEKRDSGNHFTRAENQGLQTLLTVFFLVFPTRGEFLRT